ncbi:ABC transporter ATP-binding protein [bacterium]|nr:ABC transporter ATP-binding protein [bacterium]
MQEPILKIDHLQKEFKDASNRLHAVNDISFSVSTGEFLCIVGPSGCGKTTILQLMAGLLQGSGGSIVLSGKRLRGPHRDISVVFQKPNLMPWRTVLQNIILPLQIYGVPKEEALHTGRQYLEKVGLSDFAATYPKALSGGMEQRVAVARALVQKPRILLLDEPFGALDSFTREQLNLELLRLWRDQNITAIMVTHNIREAVLLADRVLVLTPRPATIFKEIPIDLPRPRTEELEYTPEFVNLTYEIRKAIKA